MKVGRGSKGCLRVREHTLALVWLIRVLSFELVSSERFSSTAAGDVHTAGTCDSSSLLQGRVLFVPDHGRSKSSFATRPSFPCSLNNSCWCLIRQVYKRERNINLSNMFCTSLSNGKHAYERKRVGNEHCYATNRPLYGRSIMSSLLSP